jgi:hypothetical protein
MMSFMNECESLKIKMTSELSILILIVSKRICMNLGMQLLKEKKLISLKRLYSRIKKS